jgi:hypothetical protein
LSNFLVKSTFAFGNNRPALLAATERELWKALVGINRGETALTQLGIFLERFEVLKTEHSGIDPEVHWYNTEGERSNFPFWPF